jgi:MoaA/NifB/PqqE/SkfB family radical SAM enzyme
MTLEGFEARLPREGRFEAQLEGGEPTLHPRLLDMVAAARATGRCERVVLCTNGVRLPADEAGLRAILERLGAPLTVKLSVNHHLHETDPRMLERARALAAVVEEARAAGRDVRLVVNLRRRRAGDGDAWLLRFVEEAGLLPLANDFPLQRYGLASADETLDPPHLAGTDFTLVNPDGSVHGTDLLARSEAMGRLP